MNRAEKRRKQKLAKKAAPKLRDARPDLGEENRGQALDETLKLGMTHFSAGRLPEAERVCREILSKHPNQFVALHLLGLIARQAGKPEIAVELIKRALAARPDYADAYYNLGNALKDLKKLDEAKENYQKALVFKPEFVEAYYNLAGILNEQGRPVDAAKYYGKALALRPDFSEGHNNLGIIFLHLNKLEEAAASCRKAIAINPDYAEAHNNLGVVLKEQKKTDEAILCYNQALTIKPDYADAYNNLGVAYQALGKLDESVASCQKALSICPEYADAHFNLGVAFEKKNDLHKAESCFRQTVAIDPDYADAHWNLAAYQLKKGALEQGWEEYEWGLKISEGRGHARNLPFPVWEGGSLQGKNIFIYAEQGIGDEIMFSGCVPDLLEQSPNKVFLECDPRLEGLFSRSFPAVHVCGINRVTHAAQTGEDVLSGMYDLSWTGNPDDIDFVLPIGSLPKYFRNQMDKFPERDAYLLPDPEKQLAFRNGYRERWPDKRLVGVAWHSGNKTVGAERSLTLEQMDSIFASSGCQFISLQYGNFKNDLSDFKDNTGLEIFSDTNVDPLLDMDAFAAQVAALDLVISIDNSTAHIAGAIGVPTWVLLPSNANWRWCLEKTGASAWYSGVQLYKQQTPDDWDGVLEQVVVGLNDLPAAG